MLINECLYVERNPNLKRFNVWRQTLDNDALGELTKCNGKLSWSKIPTPDLVNWETDDWDIVGDKIIMEEVTYS